MSGACATDRVADVRAHYDLGNPFFALFLDPSMTYSCAKFDDPGSSLEQAQRAKIDLSLAKCELRPGQRLLDIGCGWGSTAVRAHERHGVEVTGLTISANQHAYCLEQGIARPGVNIRLQGWESFDEPVDRIVSIGAFEHFGRERYPAFFSRCHSLLPDDGVMLLHTITLGKPARTFAFLRFMHFISTRIFPGGDLPTPELVLASARAAGFEIDHVECLRRHYVLTLERWAENLEAHRHRAVDLVGAETYLAYRRYLSGAADCFRTAACSVHQFKLRVT
jgi:cyclopropane-fatty-acyl-phospholipid synthase